MRKRKQQEQGPRFDIEVFGDDPAPGRRQCKHAGEELAMIELINVLNRASHEKRVNAACILDDDHILYVGRVEPGTFAVAYGVPNR